MKAYVVVHKDLEVMNGPFHFLRFATKGHNYIQLFKTCSEALTYMDKTLQPEQFKDYSVLEFEFTKPEELLEAVHNSVHGDNTMSTFTINCLSFYNKLVL